VIVIGLSTLATAALVFMLSLRLRRREIETMTKIGGARATVVSVLAAEIVVVLATGVLLATGLTLATTVFGSQIIRAVILS
jgi:putative ABC transport system permease protein